MQMIIRFALKWVNGELSEMGEMNEIALCKTQNHYVKAKIV